MSFTYSVIGDNTKENREHLEKLGYKKHGDYGKHNDYIFAFVTTDTNEPMYKSLYDHEIELFYKDEINCIGNPALFQSVTAMRDDSDKWQFFVHKDGSFVFCDQGELKHVIDNEYMYQEYAVSEFHKATIDEIIKRFAKDENMQ